jgi:hypothetical protein
LTYTPGGKIKHSSTHRICSSLSSYPSRAPSGSSLIRFLRIHRAKRAPQVDIPVECGHEQRSSNNVSQSHGHEVGDEEVVPSCSAEDVSCSHIGLGKFGCDRCIIGDKDSQRDEEHVGHAMLEANGHEGHDREPA